MLVQTEAASRGGQPARDGPRHGSLRHQPQSLADYAQPLLDLMASIPAPEKLVLVGHSFGGFTISLAMDMYPHKISVAVFLAAFMPDCINPPSFTLDKVLIIK